MHAYMCNKYVHTLIMIAAVGFDPWSVSSKGFEDMLLPPQTTAAQQLPVGTTNVESEFHHISRLYVATILVLIGLGNISILSPLCNIRACNINIANIFSLFNSIVCAIYRKYCHSLQSTTVVFKIFCTNNYYLNPQIHINRNVFIPDAIAVTNSTHV